MADIDVVVVAYRSEATIEPCMRSLVDAKGSHGITLYLHDNHAAGGTAKAASHLALSLGLSVITEMCALNCGFGRGCNTAAAAGSSEFLLFLNPDTVLLSLPRELPAGVTGALIEDTNGRLQHTFGQTRSLWDEVQLRWLRRRPSRPQGYGYVSGASILISRTDWDALRGFDERYYMYYEDIDLGRRAANLNIPVRVHDAFKVVHAGGLSAQQEPRARSLILSYESGATYFQNTRRYRLLVGADALLRILYATLHGRGGDAQAYASLAYRTIRKQAPGLPVEPH